MPMFSLMVRPENSPEVWKRTVMCFRRTAGSYSLILMSLMNKSPSVGSDNRVSKLANVDFPAPLYLTISHQIDGYRPRNSNHLTRVNNK